MYAPKHFGYLCIVMLFMIVLAGLSNVAVAQRIAFTNETSFSAAGNAFTTWQPPQQMGNFWFKVVANNRTRLTITWSISVTSGAGNINLSSFDISSGSSQGNVTVFATTMSGTQCIALTSGTAPRTTWIRIRCLATPVNAGTNATVTANCQLVDSDRDYSDGGSCAADPSPLTPAIIGSNVITPPVRNVYIARNVSIVKVQDMVFGWMLVGQSKTINPYSSTATQALRFGITAEPNSTISTTFPLSATLTRSGGSETITMDRTVVKRVVSADASAPSSVPTISSIGLTDSEQTDDYNFPGTTPTSSSGSMRRADYWIGGTLSIPQGTVPGMYSGTYTVTVTNYTL